MHQYDRYNYNIYGSNQYGKHRYREKEDYSGYAHLYSSSAGKRQKKKKKSLWQSIIIILILLYGIFTLNKIAEKRKSALISNAGIEDTKTEVNNNEIEHEQSTATNNSENNSTNNSTVNNNLTNEESKKAIYYIKVNIQENTVTVYDKDEEGNYTKPIKAMVCSTGKATPKSGTYTISQKYRWLPLFGNVYGQYSTRIVDHILFHSVPYQKKTLDSLEYWEYDKLGTSASAGCIRLTVEDSYWIYTYCESGTKVEFYSSSDPGPLGKPEVQKISNESEKLRNWDPTDHDDENPWKSKK